MSLLGSSWTSSAGASAWRHGLARLGAPGLLGVLLMAGALGVWVWLVPAARQALVEQQDQVDHVREQLKAGSTPGMASTSLSTQSELAWQALWGALPAEADGAALMAEVLAAAQRQGVVLGAVQFSADPLKGLDVVGRQRLVLPVEAPYPALRSWLAAVLQHPGISLDALDVSRDQVMSDQVRARVTLSLWSKRRLAMSTPSQASAASTPGMPRRSAP